MTIDKATDGAIKIFRQGIAAYYRREGLSRLAGRKILYFYGALGVGVKVSLFILMSFGLDLMSLQFRVRFLSDMQVSTYQSNGMPRLFSLFEDLQDKIGTVNFLSAPETGNEEELSEQIEEELGGEPDGDEFGDFQMNLEKELNMRGEFSPVSQLLQSVSAFLGFFQSRSEEIFKLVESGNIKGAVVAQELSLLVEELKKNPEGRARFVIK